MTDFQPTITDLDPEIAEQVDHTTGRDMPTYIMVFEYLDPIPNVDTFLKLLTYCNVPTPQYVIVVNGDYYAILPVPDHAKEDDIIEDCRVITDDDRPMLLVHAPKCPRTISIRENMRDGTANELKLCQTYDPNHDALHIASMPIPSYTPESTDDERPTEPDQA